MQSDYGVLFGRLYRVDRSGAGPPWPLLVWTEATATWDPIGIMGATGPTGPAGAPGPTGPIYWQGAWDSAHAYLAGDGVSDNGSSYVCILAHTNHEPPNSTYWNVLASKGDTGATGATGAAGTSGALTNLGESILSSDTAAITFASISASYRDLHLSLTGRSDQSDLVSVALRFNADSGSNYDWTDWYNPSSNGSGSPSLEAVAANTMLRLGYVSGTNAPSGGCGAVRTVIHDYARTNWRKNVTSECQCERTLGASYRFTAGGTWRSSAAVTSITLVLAAGNFKSGTVATLWGAG